MKLRVVPALRGWVWAREGLRLAQQQPLGFASLLGLMITSALLLVAIPLVGLVVVVTAMPLAWMCFMLASRRAVSGQKINLGVIMEALGDADSRRVWLKLGSAYALASVLVMLLANVMGPDLETLAKAAEASSESADADALLNNSVLLENMLWRLGLTLPVSLLFWHTPALVHWGRLPVGKALFFSAVASWRNLGALTVYGASWAAVLLVVGLPVQALASVLPSPTLATMLAAAAGLWVASAFYASLYFSVVDCFEPSGSEGQGGGMDLPASPALTPKDG